MPGALESSSFSPPGGAGENGSGPDSTDALQAFLTRLSEGQHHYARIAPGRYRLTRTLDLSSAALRDLTIEADGAEFVFDLPEPEKNRAYFRIANPTRSGNTISLTGLTARLARPAVRTGGSDMIRVAGFRDYRIQGISIPSADNMALTIGRGDPEGWTPYSIVVEGCTFGGRREAQPHSHGSIGDTAVWIISPAETTRVTGCNIRETGDDAIYVGHSDSKQIRSVIIKDNRLTDTGVGIGVSVPGAEIVNNHIDRTNVCAIRCEKQGENQGSNALIRGNFIRRPGQLEAGDIAEKIINKPHPHGIFIHLPIGRISIIDNQIIEARECALAIRSHKDGACGDIRIEGGRYERIGVDRSGDPIPGQKRSAVFRRDGHAPTTIDGFRALGPTMVKTTNPLLHWSASGLGSDGDVAVSYARIVDSNLRSTALVEASARIGASLSSVQISYSATNSEIPQAVHASPPGLAAKIRVLREA